MGADRFDIIEELNGLMAEEVEASLRYFHMRFRLRGKNRRAVEAFLEEAVKETMEHADAIAHQIRTLGHVPLLRVQLVLGGGTVRAEDALAEALEVERQALDAYKDLLPRVEHHPALASFIGAQIDVETEHVQAILGIVHDVARLKLVAKSGAHE